MEARFVIAERVKSKANALVKAGKHKFAQNRYDRLLKLMESTRDYEAQVSSYDRHRMLNLGGGVLLSRP